MPTSLTAAKEAGQALAKGDAAACESIIQAALNGPETIAKGERGILLEMLGRARTSLGKGEKALAAFTEAIGCLEQTLAENGAENGLIAEYISALLNYSFACMELGKLEKADCLGGKALEYAEEKLETDNPLLASVCFGLSAVKYRQKNYEDAEELTRKALAIWRKLDNRNKMATCFNNLGRIYEMRGQNKQGIQWHTQAVALRRELPDKLDLAFSLGNRGVAWAMQGQLEEAIADLREAVEIYRRHNGSHMPECQGFLRNLKVCEKAWRHRDSK